MTDAVGMRLLLDGFVTRRLSEDDLRLVLPRITKGIGMTPIGYPVIFPHEWGPSGYQFLAESHIGVDYMYWDQVALEAFSCKVFDIPEAIALLVKEFHISSITKQAVITHRFDDHAPARHGFELVTGGA